MSFLVGKAGEQKVIELLKEVPVEVELNTAVSRKALASYDFSFDFKGSHFAEVKYDKMSSLTGNIAMEVYNYKSKYLSGILSTKSNLWFLVAGKSIYGTETAKLKSFIHKEMPCKIVAGGDDNSVMLLYKKERILPIFRELKDGVTTKNWLNSLRGQ